VYLWDNGDTQASSVRVLDEGSYTLTVTAGNCTFGEVSDTHLLAIGPEATFTSNTPILVGETAVFTPTVTGSGPLTYLWDFGDGITSTLEAPTHLYAASGTYEVTLTVTNSFGSDTYIAEFVVNTPQPPVVFTFLALVVK
jgi:PKD repeat protein